MENKLILYFSGLLFLLMPWYYMSSGLPQPVDLVVIMLFSIFILIKLPHFKVIYKATIFKLIVYLTIYSIIVFLLNFIVSSMRITLNLIEQNIYYLVLLTLFLLMFLRLQYLYGREKSYRLILWFIFLSCLFPLVTWLKHPAQMTRISLTFNNPNQLGFFSLVNMSMIYYMGLLSKEHQVKMNRLMSVLILNINLLFLFLSASRSCYPVILLYIVSYFIIFNVKLSRDMVWLYRLLGGCFALCATTGLITKLFLHMKEIRYGRLPISFGELTYDFYYRALRGIDFNSMDIWSLLIGNGSYTTLSRGYLEFHNNFIALFNQIGLLGLIFYLYINIAILRLLYQKGWLYLPPYFCYLFYSMFQYSYRTRLNWLFFAIIIYLTLDLVNKYRTELKGSA